MSVGRQHRNCGFDASDLEYATVESGRFTPKPLHTVLQSSHFPQPS